VLLDAPAPARHKTPRSTAGIDDAKLLAAFALEQAERTNRSLDLDRVAKAEPEFEVIADAMRRAGLRTAPRRPCIA
jgi:hypothetical protein